MAHLYARFKVGRLVRSFPFAVTKSVERFEIVEQAPGAAPPLQGVPLVYANGFQIVLSNADIGLLVQVDNVPQMRVAMSYTTAKTLRVALEKMLTDLESVTGHTIMTSQQVGEGLQRISNAAK